MLTYTIPLRIKFSSCCDFPSLLTFLCILAIENWAQKGLEVLHVSQLPLNQEEEDLLKLGFEAVSLVATIFK